MEKRLPQPPEAGVEYYQKNFAERFLADLRSAKQYVLIQTVYIGLQALKVFLHEIAKCIRRGVQVCIFVREPDNWYVHRDLLDPVTQTEFNELQGLIDLLRGYGAHVTMLEDIHVKVAVFDGLIGYSGSLNFFSNGKSTNNTIRFDHPAIALNLQDEHKLFCVECLEAKAHPPAGKMIVIAKESPVGVVLRKLRIENRFSIRSMADRAGLTSSHLHDIEKGHASALTEIFASICQVAGRSVLIVPAYSVEAIRRLVERIPPPKK